MTTGSVYVIKNKINSKEYVGITTRGIEQRFAQHVNTALRKDSRCAIHRAMIKYGVDLFYVESLEENIPIETLGEREKFWIINRNSLIPNGYNIRTGGNDSGAKPVFMIDPFTNQIIQEYPSITAAAEVNNADISHLCAVCNEKSQQKSCGGYKWCFVSEYNPEKIQNIKPHLLNRPVCQLELYTCKILNVFNCVADACKYTNTNQAALSDCLSGKYKTANGYWWCYKDQFESFTPKYPFKRVQQFDTSMNLLNVYNSANDASYSLFNDLHATHSIRHACKNNKLFLNCYWRYIDNEASCIDSESRMETTN